MRSRTLLPLLVALALAEGALAGCAGRPARPPAPAFSRQEQSVRAAERARASGRLQEAIGAQERALLAARSVEDVEGIALRVLDLAALHRAAGNPAKARAALAELLAAPPPLEYPGRWRAEAARLAGLIALDAGDAADGARWAARALELCRAASCPGEGAIVILQARAAFLGGDPGAAAALAQRALPLTRAARDDEERANAHRIIADAALAAGRHADAARAYGEALAADKRLGLERKIALDLVGLGRAAQAAGDDGEALGYFERARAVALAAGDDAGAAAAAAAAAAVRDRPR